MRGRVRGGWFTIDGCVLLRVRGVSLLKSPSDVAAGEDDGSFTVTVEKQGASLLSVNFLVSGAQFNSITEPACSQLIDTSEYPSSHQTFCHSLDPDISARLESVVEAISEQPSQPIKSLIDVFLNKVKVATAPKAPIRVVSDSEPEDDSEEETYDYADSDDDMGQTKAEPKAVLSMLQSYVISDACEAKLIPPLVTLSTSSRPPTNLALLAFVEATISFSRSRSLSLLSPNPFLLALSWPGIVDFCQSPTTCVSLYPGSAVFTQYCRPTATTRWMPSD